MVSPRYVYSLELSPSLYRKKRINLHTFVLTHYGRKDDGESQLAVSAQATFPAASEIFGVKLVNGHPTEAIISFTNDEASPIGVNFVGGSLWTLDEEKSVNVRNLSATSYRVQLDPGQTESVSYSFATEMHPQDLRLLLTTILSNEEGGVFPVAAYNGTISIVEPETSVFDPQM